METGLRALAARCAGAVVVCALGGCEPAPAGLDAGGARDAPATFFDTGPLAPADLLGRLGDPFAPARPVPGTAVLVSSREPEDPEGMLDRDFNFFVSREGETAVLYEADGPGIVTRLWLTVGGDPDPAIGGNARIGIEIDGSPVELLPGEPTPTVNQLTSGTVPGLPRPWARDRSVASGGYFLAVPIAYASHIRITMTAPPALWNYYQVDALALPPGTSVESFDGVTTAAEAAALESATALWERHEHPGTLRTLAGTLAVGASLTLEVAEAAVLTELVVTTPLEARARLRARLEVDGAVAAEGTVAQLFGTGAPTIDYSSALTASDTTAAHLYAPIPVDAGATLTLTLASGTDVAVELGARVAALPADDDLGHFRADCRESVADTPYDVCEAAPVERHPNVVVSDFTSTVPAQYVGQTYAMFAPRVWWWALENDHEVWVDGVPTILGTGTEDYFGGGFYFAVGPYASPTAGAPGWERPADGTATTALYRWHLVDGIPFASSLRFEYEAYIDETRWSGCSLYYVFDR